MWVRRLSVDGGEFKLPPLLPLGSLPARPILNIEHGRVPTPTATNKIFIMRLYGTWLGTLPSVLCAPLERILINHQYLHFSRLRRTLPVEFSLRVQRLYGLAVALSFHQMYGEWDNALREPRHSWSYLKLTCDSLFCS